MVRPEHFIVFAAGVWVCWVFSVGQSATGPWFPGRGRGSPAATERSEACPLLRPGVRGTPVVPDREDPDGTRRGWGWLSSREGRGCGGGGPTGHQRVSALVVRPGSGGHRPPRASMPRPIRACRAESPDAIL